MSFSVTWHDDVFLQETEMHKSEVRRLIFLNMSIRIIHLLHWSLSPLMSRCELEEEHVITYWDTWMLLSFGILFLFRKIVLMRVILAQTSVLSLQCVMFKICNEYLIKSTFLVTFVIASLPASLPIFRMTELSHF